MLRIGSGGHYLTGARRPRCFAFESKFTGNCGSATCSHFSGQFAFPAKSNVTESQRVGQLENCHVTELQPVGRLNLTRYLETTPAGNLTEPKVNRWLTEKSHVTVPEPF